MVMSKLSKKLTRILVGTYIKHVNTRILIEIIKKYLIQKVLSLNSPEMHFYLKM